jgi:UDP-N-acetylmuramate--alanine ligase
MQSSSRSVIKEKMRIGVLMGGRSGEAEVSFNSGRTICDHIDTARYDVIPLFQTTAGLLYILPWYFLHRGKRDDFLHRLQTEAQSVAWDDLKKHVDFIYIAVHGRYAEDGSLQGLLNVLNIPYMGTKVLGSALGMNKAFQKKILKAAGIEVPRGIVVTAREVFMLNNQHEYDEHALTKVYHKISVDTVLDRLHAEGVTFPCVVKPVNEGSSLGIRVMHEKAQVVDALVSASLCDNLRPQDVLIEEKIEGMEFTFVGIERYSNHANGWVGLPLTEVVIEKGSTFYDYEQKYMLGRAQKITPARCSQQEQERITTTCIAAARSLSFKTIARIDGFLLDDGRVMIIDPNSLSGMGPTSFVFDQAVQAGLSHTEFINHLIDVELKGNSMDTDVRGTYEHNVHDQVRTRIGVLLGGDSNEREISLESGRNVCYKLSPHAYEVTPLFVTADMKVFKLLPHVLIKHATHEIVPLVRSEDEVKWSEFPALFDFIFIALHGGKGENGSIQGLLDMLDMPYNGSGVLASALCMDKYRTNFFLRSQGFAVPDSVLIEKQWWESMLPSSHYNDLLMTRIEEHFSGTVSFPLIVKPYDDGCSVFVNLVRCITDLHEAIRTIFMNGKDALMIEEYIHGDELTVGVYGNDYPIVLPPSRSFASGGSILSMEDKFLPGAGENQTPALLGEYEKSLIQHTISEVYKHVGCSGYARIDCFYQRKEFAPRGEDRVVILEINTLPALTPATCLFHQAAEIGLKPMEFIEKIITLGLELRGKNPSLYQEYSKRPTIHS